MTTLQKVIDHFGGTQETLAKALGIQRTAISMWRGKVPPLRACQIEVLSGGKFRAADLMGRQQKRAA